MSIRTKKLLFVLILVLIFGGLLSWYIFARPTPKIPSVTATSTPKALIGASPTTSPIAPPIHIIEQGEYYDADLQYPSAIPLQASAPANTEPAAILTLKNFSENTLNTFKNDAHLVDLTPAQAQIEGLDQGQKYTLSDGYTMYSGTNTVSYAFNINEDTLGAHPNTDFQTFTFDSRTGAVISLQDLFVPDSDYLTELSALSRTILIAQEGADADSTFIDPGTTATADNFKNFAIDGTNLVLIFPPYQVGPYSLGTETIRIPLTQLKSILKLEYQ